MPIIYKALLSLKCYIAVTSFISLKDQVTLNGFMVHIPYWYLKRIWYMARFIWSLRIGNHHMYTHIIPPRSHDYPRQALVTTLAHIRSPLLLLAMEMACSSLLGIRVSLQRTLPRLRLRLLVSSLYSHQRVLG